MTFKSAAVANLWLSFGLLCCVHGRGLAQNAISTGTRSGFRMYYPNSNDWWLDPSKGNFDIRANGGFPTASFTSLGNLGIGTTSPASKLDVLAGAGSDQAAQFQGNKAAGGYVDFYDAVNSAVRGYIGYGSTLFTSLPDNTWFGLRSQGALAFGRSGAVDMVINGGNVGIGTTSPGAKIEVAGGVKISGSNNGITFPDNSVQTTAAAGGNLWTGIGANVAYLTNPAAYVGIGTTNPGVALDVSGYMRTSALYLGANNNVALYQPATTGNLYVGTAGNNGAVQLFAGNLSVTPNAGLVTLDMTDPDSGGKRFDIRIDNLAEKLVDITNNSPIYFQRNAGNAPILTMDGSGNVGINTYAPGARFGILPSAADSFVVNISSQDGTTPLLTLNRLGNLGIGTALPNSGGYAGKVVTIEHGGSGGGYNSILEMAQDSQGGGSATLGFYDRGASAANTIAKVIATGANNKTGNLNFQTSNSAGSLGTNLFLQSGGNVGVGTSSPATLLNIYNAGADTAFPLSTNAQLTGGPVLRISNPTVVMNAHSAISFEHGNNTYGSLIESRYRGGSASLPYSALDLYTVNNGNYYDRMTIDENGYVGIGTTAPARLLSLNGGASDTHLILQNANSGFAINNGFDLVSVQNASGNVPAGTAQVWNYQNAPMSFGTNNVERMRISNSGSIFIGSGSSGSMGGALQVFAPTSAGIAAISLYADNAGRGLRGQTVDFVNAASGSDYALEFSGGSGNVATTLTAYVNGGGAYGNLALQAGGGNVGVGTTNPQAGLMVEKDNGSGWAAWFRKNSAANGVLLGTSGLGTLGTVQGVNSGGSAASLSINPVGGFVGIGTTNPGQALDVAFGSIRSDTGFCIGASCVTNWSSAAMAGKLRFTRGAVLASDVDSNKDLQCRTEFGSNYVAAGQGEVQIYTGGGYAGGYYFNMAAFTSTWYYSAVGTISTGSSGSYSVACIQANSPMRFTRVGVSATAIDSMKDAQCVAEFGANYMAAGVLEASTFFGGSYAGSVFNVAGYASSVNYCNSGGQMCTVSAGTYSVACVTH